MPKLPVINSKDLINILLKKGFILDRTKGSHYIFFHPESKKRVVVPFHKKDLPKGTLSEILKQAGISRNELIDD